MFRREIDDLWQWLWEEQRITRWVLLFLLLTNVGQAMVALWG